MWSGRVIFDGWLAHDTADQIASAMRSTLEGQLYTFVTVNEGFGYRPEVRTNLHLREPITARVVDEAKLVFVRFNDQDYVCSIDSRAETEVKAYALPDDSLDKVRITVYEREIRIEHRAPAGWRLLWTLAVTGPIPTEEEDADEG
jgi:hypothetical protein